MSSLASPDDAPFVFGAYASHLNEVSALGLAAETEDAEPALGIETDDHTQSASLRTFSARRSAALS